MPLAGAIASVAGGLGIVLGLSYWLEMDASVVNVVTVLGLGLSIDYGLLIVSRFREELHALVDADDGQAVRRRRGDGAVRSPCARHHAHGRTHGRRSRRSRSRSRSPACCCSARRSCARSAAPGSA